MATSPVDIDAIMRQVAPSSTPPPMLQGGSSIPFNPPAAGPSPSDVGNQPMENEGMASASRSKHQVIGNLIRGVSNAASKVLAAENGKKTAAMTSKMTAMLQQQQSIDKFNAAAASTTDPTQKTYYQQMAKQSQDKLDHYMSDPKTAKAYLKATSQDLTNPDKNKPEKDMLAKAATNVQQTNQLQQQAQASAKNQQAQPKAPVQTGSQAGLPGTAINPQPATKPAPMQGGSQPGLPGTGINPVPITRTAQPNVQGQVQNRAAAMPSMGFPQQTAPAVSGAPIINPNQPAPTNAQASGQQAPVQTQKKPYSMAADLVAHEGVVPEENPAYAAWVKEQEEWHKTQQKMLVDLLEEKLTHQDKLDEQQAKFDADAKRWREHDKALTDRADAHDKMELQLGRYKANMMLQAVRERTKAAELKITTGMQALNDAHKSYAEAEKGYKEALEQIDKLEKQRSEQYPQDNPVLAKKEKLKPKNYVYDNTPEDAKEHPEYHKLNVAINLQESAAKQFQEEMDKAKKRIADYELQRTTGFSAADGSDGVIAAAINSVANSTEQTSSRPTEKSENEDDFDSEGSQRLSGESDEDYFTRIYNNSAAARQQ